MDEKSSQRVNRKRVLAVIALLALCLFVFLTWKGFSSPSEPAPSTDVQATSAEGDSQAAPVELPMRAATGISMSAQETSDALEIERTQPGGTNPANLADESWTILVYLCGSDLESQAGAATKDRKSVV